MSPKEEQTDSSAEQERTSISSSLFEMVPCNGAQQYVSCSGARLLRRCPDYLEIIARCDAVLR